MFLRYNAMINLLKLIPNKNWFSGVLSEDTASSISLGIILIFILVWFILENFILAKYLKWIFTVYPVVIFAFIGVVIKIRDDGTTKNLILALIDLLLAIILFLVRIGISVYKFYNPGACLIPLSSTTVKQSKK